MVEYSKAIGELVQRADALGAGSALGIVQSMRGVERSTRALEGVVKNRNPVETDAAHLKKIHDAGKRLQASLQASRQMGTDALNSAVSSLSAKVRAATGLRPAETVAESIQQSEIRQALLGMKADQRAKVVTDALAANDAATLNALNNGAPYLSGVAAERINGVIETYQKQVAPDLVAEIEAVLEADNMLQTAVRAAERAATEAQDERAMQKIVEAEARAGAAMQEFGEAMQS